MAIFDKIDLIEIEPALALTDEYKVIDILRSEDTTGIVDTFRLIIT